MKAISRIWLALALAGCGGGGSAGSPDAPPTATMTLSISATQTYLNDSVEISWSSSGSNSCSASGDWSGTKAGSGTESVPAAVVGEFSFSLACSNATSSASKTVNLKILEELSIRYADQNIVLNEDDVEVFDAGLATTSRAPLSDLVYSLTDSPENGSASISGSIVTYTPKKDFFGADSLGITATAENQSASSTVIITVSGENDAPSLVLEYPTSYSSPAMPLFVSENSIFIPYSVSDADNDLSEISISASINGDDALVTASSDIVEIALDASFISGSTLIEISASDGQDVASGSLSLWIARTISEPSGSPRVNQLLGNVSDSSRGFHYAVVLDAIEPGAVRDAAYSSLTYYLGEFLSDTDSRRQALIEASFNVYIIDHAPGAASGLNVEIGCYEDSPETYCVEDASDSAFELIADVPALAGITIDSISIITGVEGRGVNLGSVNVQPLLGVSNGDFSGPNRMLKTLKHEFGHAFQILGDHYTSDYLLEDDTGDKLVDMTDGLENLDAYSVDITLEEDPYKVKWRHFFDDLEEIPGRDTQIKRDNSDIGYWPGCYYHDQNCFRSSYNSIMNGDYSAYSELIDYESNGTQYMHTQFDDVGAEAFALATLQEQGLNSIYAELNEAGELLVGHRVRLPATLFAIDWYIDGLLIGDWSVSSAQKLTGAELDDENGVPYVERIKVPKGAAGSFSSVAYRVRELGDNPLIKVNDAIDAYGDVYLGAFSTRVGVFACSESNTSWSDVDTTYCNSTLSVRFVDGWQYSPDWSTQAEMLNARGNDIYFLYEDSGLGSQFLINWDFFQ